MRSQTLKFAKVRLAQWEAVRVYYYEFSSRRTVRRAGVVKIAKTGE